MKYKIYLILILVLAIFLRFVKLGNLPNSYTPDELAQGYSAYSILNTSKDEWGSSNWLNLRSFGDYKPPLQTLLMIPSIKVFGLTPFAVRFPNAFLSIFTILLTYLIANHIFKDKKIGLLSALFMSISPWSLPMSRIALEANLVIFIVSLATFLFLKSVQNKNYFLFILSILFFGISLFTYHSAKIFTPLLLIILFFYQKIYRYKIFTIILVLIFGLSLLFQYQNTHQIKNSRTSDIAIFNPDDNWQSVSDNQYEITQNGLPYPIVKIFYNKLVYLGEIFTQGYFSYFSPQFLITQGAGETTYGMITGFGVLGIIPTFGLLILLLLILKNSYPKSQKSFIFFGLIILIAPLIASLAKGQYSANRVSLMMPFIQIACAAGIIFFIKTIPQKIKKITTYSIFIIFTFSSLMFLQRYFFQGNQLLSEGMLYGHQQAINYVKNNPQIDQVIYSRKLSEPQ
ncbi:MAG: glycosyltransferase family 39 protein, partial [Candidatus Shapirobacteria bacterium]